MIEKNFTEANIQKNQKIQSKKLHNYILNCKNVTKIEILEPYTE